MIFDYLDFKILKEFYSLGDKKETSSWTIMKKLFPCGRDMEHNKIKRRIEKMANDGLFLVTKNSNKSYSLILDKIRIDKFKFPDGFSEGIAIKTDKWEIFEL